VPLRRIDPALTETFMGRKGLVQSSEAEKVPILGIADIAGPVTLLGLVETNEFVAVPDDGFAVARGFMYSLYNDSRPVPTLFSPR
jgi:hypothetical protein